MNIIDKILTTNNEKTAADLQKAIQLETGDPFPIATVKRLRKKLGWVKIRARYCQLIRQANQASRLDFAIRCIQTNESFNNVIFSDESTIELDCHAKMVFWKPRLAESSEVYADSIRHLLKPKPK